MKRLYLALLGGLFAMSASAQDTPVTPVTQVTEKATFAGGCFWCLEKPFDAVEGVISTVSGYANGHTKSPSYEEVSRGTTGHTEVLQVTFNPNKVSYAELLEIFWKNHDPLDDGGQFCDRGYTYRPAIMYANEAQQQIAEQSKAALQASNTLGGDIKTAIEPLKSFYDAEDYHQDYYKKNPIRYNYYRFSCGRDKRLDELWK